MRRSRRAGSTSGTLQMSCSAARSPCIGRSPPADATERRHWWPRYASAPLLERPCGWRGGVGLGSGGGGCGTARMRGTRRTAGASSEQVNHCGRDRYRRGGSADGAVSSAAHTAAAVCEHRAHQVVEGRAADDADHVAVHHKLAREQLQQRRLACNAAHCSVSGAGGVQGLRRDYNRSTMRKDGCPRRRAVARQWAWLAGQEVVLSENEWPWARGARLRRCSRAAGTASPAEWRARGHR